MRLYIRRGLENYETTQETKTVSEAIRTDSPANNLLCVWILNTTSRQTSRLPF